MHFVVIFLSLLPANVFDVTFACSTKRLPEQTEAAQVHIDQVHLQDLAIVQLIQGLDHLQFLGSVLLQFYDQDHPHRDLAHLQPSLHHLLKGL